MNTLRTKDEKCARLENITWLGASTPEDVRVDHQHRNSFKYCQ